MTTPARRQYLRIKNEHQDAILLFRMGDFYETFDDDARIISRELEIALTSREFGAGSRIPLAGIPYHSLDSYLARLIRQGYKVAICEQTSDPAKSRGLVDRAVVRVVTPGHDHRRVAAGREIQQLPGRRCSGWRLCRCSLRGHLHRRVRDDTSSCGAAGCRAG